ncbi:MAG: SRPBCC family protein [Bacillota bacterium]
MIKVNVSVNINKPHQEIFAYIANFENNPKWQGGMLEATFTSDGPLQKGSTYEQVATFLGKKIYTTFEVIQFEKDYLIKINSVESSFPITVTRFVEPAAEGTKVSAIVEGDASKFFKVAQPLLKSMVKRSVTSDYNRLKKLMES